MGKKRTLYRMVLVLVAFAAASGSAVAEGELVWAKWAGGTLDDFGRGIAVLPDGSILVSGAFMSDTTFGFGEANETTLTSAAGGGRDVYLAKYNADGTLAWVRREGGTGSEESGGVAHLPDGSALVTGRFGDTEQPGYTVTLGEGEPNETTLASAGYDDIFVAKNVVPRSKKSYERKQLHVYIPNPNRRSVKNVP